MSGVEKSAKTDSQNESGPEKSVCLIFYIQFFDNLNIQGTLQLY